MYEESTSNDIIVIYKIFLILIEGEMIMKKFVPIVLSLSLLGVVSPINYDNHNKVEAATANKVFEDPNLYQYTSTDTYQIKDGVFYSLYKGKSIKPSQTWIANSKLISLASDLLDKDRYLKIVYKPSTKSTPETLSYRIACNDYAVDYGARPIIVSLYLNKRYKEFHNAKYSIDLDYDWYDVKTDTWYSKAFETKLKKAFIVLHGKEKGTNIFNYVLGVHKKYREHPPKPTSKEIILKKKIGSTTIFINVSHNTLYIYFS